MRSPITPANAEAVPRSTRGSAAGRRGEAGPIREVSAAGLSDYLRTTRGRAVKMLKSKAVNMTTCLNGHIGLEVIGSSSVPPPSAVLRAVEFDQIRAPKTTPPGRPKQAKSDVTPKPRTPPKRRGRKPATHCRDCGATLTSANKVPSRAFCQSCRSSGTPRRPRPIPTAKACTRCGAVKPATAFPARRHTTTPKYRGAGQARPDSACKDCRNAYQRARRARRRAACA